jgi:hypothetical protein
MKIRAIKDTVLCTDGEFDDHVTDAGLIIKNNIGQGDGITARWFKIFECGPDVHEDISSRIGWWVLVAYGRWSDSITVEDDRLPEGKSKMWRVDGNDCLVLAETKQHAINYNKDMLHEQRKTL